MEFLGTLGNLHLMLEFIAVELKKSDFQDKELGLIELACEEAIVNIIHHAYKNQGDDKITIFTDPTENGVKITIRDFGFPFDPKNKQIHVDPKLPAEKRKIGGLGIHLMKQVTDQLEYQRVGEENVLQLTFVVGSEKRKES